MSSNTLRQAVGPHSGIVDQAMVDRAHRLWNRPGNRSAFVDFVNTDQPDRTGEIPAISVPTLVLRSASMDGQHFTRDIAGVSRRSIRRAVTCSREEDPQWVAETIREYLTSLPQSGVSR
ncbi:alpha/beta fold hydrolase [Nocardia asiatica]|uniref:alpha/beta fold hydrolase n=1 Tax=Nocardia asiatica TaxID=209252 RepID=UPI003EDFE41C